MMTRETQVPGGNNNIRALFAECLLEYVNCKGRKMKQDEWVSRYEVNRNVRMIFTRHDVDLTRIDYSFMGSTVYLYGDLTRSDGDFFPKDIELMAKEIAALPHVRDIQFDLNNWVPVSLGDSWQFTLKKKSAASGNTAQAGTLTDSTVIIEKTEDLEVVLNDISKGSEKKLEDL